jgi:hypothetical protein
MAGGRPAARFIEVTMFGPTGPLEGYSLSHTNKVGYGGSTDYDYTGSDLAQKRGDDLSQTSAERASALYKGDIGSVLSLGRRIADLKGYLDAYRSGGTNGGVFGEVVPGVRLKSQSNTADFTNDNDAQVSFHNPKWNTHKHKDWE